MDYDYFHLWFNPFLPSVAVFECFFDDDICNVLAHMMTKYANEENDVHEFDIEVRSFIGILLLSGYVNVFWWQMMWEADSETFNVAVAMLWDTTSLRT